MQLTEYIKKIRGVFPPEYAMQGDRVGLQVQSGKYQIKKVLVAYETTLSTVLEAEKCGADMITSFHPLIFFPMKNIIEDDRQGDLVTELIRKNIAVYVVHTSFDTFHHGTSSLLAEALGLETSGFLIPNGKNPEWGMGVTAVPSKPMTAGTLVSKVKEVCGGPVRYSRDISPAAEIHRVGIVGGSGFEFFYDALKAQCDAFITGDCSYHKFFEVNGRLLLIDPGHNESEKFVAEGMYRELNREFFGEEIEFVLSQTDTNPVLYL